MGINISSKWSVYGCIILAILLAVSVGVAGYFYQKSKEPAQIAQGKVVLAHPEQAIIDSPVDKRGVQHAQILANGNQVPIATLKDTSIRRDSVIKRVTEDLNLSDPSDIRELTSENLHLRADILRLKKDSANLAMLVYHDQTISFDYFPADSTVRNLMIDMQLHQVNLTKRKIFSNQLIYDFYADDPRVTFSGFNHFTVTMPQPFFGLTTDARATYNFATGRFTPSVGLNFRTGSFYLEGREYLFMKDSRLNQSQLLSVGFKQTVF